MNRLPIEKRAQIIRCLVEGNSMRATELMVGCSINTVTKLLRDVGSACLEYQDMNLVDLPCTRIQCDEIWSFCYAKQKNVPDELKGEFGYGDVWTWTALCADTKIVPCCEIGDRSAQTASRFMHNLAERMNNRIQLTTDGHRAYLEAVDHAFGTDIDYAMLVKLYGEDPQPEKRYSPADCIGTKKKIVSGDPEKKGISTSYVERQNLTMRMSMRRFTRLTNGFSKKIENHMHAISLHFMYYNFARIHKSLRVSPAMEAGIDNHLWTTEEIADLPETLI